MKELSLDELINEVRFRRRCGINSISRFMSNHPDYSDSKEKIKMDQSLKNITQISADQFHAVMDDLQVFIHRVATDKNASPEEVAALPAIVKEIFNLPIENMFRPLPSYPSLSTYNPFSTYNYNKEIMKENLEELIELKKDVEQNRKEIEDINKQLSKMNEDLDKRLVALCSVVAYLCNIIWDQRGRIMHE